MKRIILAAAVTLCLVPVATPSSADTLVLRDGTRVQGRLVGVAARTITFRHANGVSRRYRTSEIDALEFLTDGERPRDVSRRDDLNNRDRDLSSRDDLSNRSLEAPAGAELIVRTARAIDSRDARADDTFSAIVEQDVTNASGRVVIPRGSTAQLVILRLSSGGATGGAEMALDVESIAIDGRRYLVGTTDLTRDSDTGIGTNRRTAEAVGGGAAIGSIIGVIAAGGKGAAIGGIVGAAGGAGVQVLTKERDVRVPAETVLTFRLDERITLRSAR
jgi:hypothetical protein